MSKPTKATIDAEIEQVIDHLRLATNEHNVYEHGLKVRKALSHFERVLKAWNERIMS